jgi:endonuclease/exonuclease/phosphatase family metal-dependent hydrolase
VEQSDGMRAANRCLRLATYNIHKCRGLDCRVRPDRIVEVLREIDADIIALQEVVSIRGGGPEKDQAGYIANTLGFEWSMGKTRTHNGGVYGNMVLSRYPLEAARNYNISAMGRERRGCLRVDLVAGGTTLLHVFNVHLGTAYLERRKQVRLLMTSNILNNRGLRGVRIVLGDFNEWTRGLATRLLRARFQTADLHKWPRLARSYPGILPLLHLDHIYFDPGLEMESLSLHRSRSALIASDHLPLVADFRMLS